MKGRGTKELVLKPSSLKTQEAASNRSVAITEEKS